MLPWPLKTSMHPLGLFSTLFVSVPDDFVTVPAHSPCRIFNTALSQGHCGSCAAFEVSTAVAMRLCLIDGVDFIPSPFRLFDCSGGTCDTGLSLRTAANVARFGIGDIDASAKTYGLPCDFRWEHSLAFRTGFHTRTDPQQIKRAILAHGPMPGSVLMHDHRTEQHHSIVVIGWGSQPEAHWVIQNSWGEEWHPAGRGNISLDQLLYAVDIDDRDTLKPALQFVFVATMIAFVMTSALACYAALRPQPGVK